MAKERLITRTMEFTEVEYKFADLDKNTISTQTMTLPGNLNNEAALRMVKQAVDTETIQAIHVTILSTSAKRYGMPESTFMLYAQEV